MAGRAPPQRIVSRVLRTLPANERTGRGRTLPALEQLLVSEKLASLLHVGRLRPFGSLDNLELHGISFLQGPVAIPDYS
jgi:hypothetical protein